MSKFNDFVNNHKSVVVGCVCVVATAAVMGVGVLAGYKAGSASNKIHSKDESIDSPSTLVGGLTDETIEVDNSFAGISAQEAEEIALRDAGLDAGEVTIVKSETEVDGGVKKHEIEFISGSDKYEYEIDANTGKVLFHELEHEELVTEKLTQSEEPIATPQTNTQISIYEAKAIALADAGLSEVTLTKAKLDHDDDRDVFDIEFYSGNTKYEYEITVYGGSILKKDVEFTDSKTTAQGEDIGLEAAKKAAVEDAGFAYGDVSFTKAEKDTDDGISVYEIEFRCGDIEYDYEINASTGGIIKKESKTIKSANSAAPQSDEKITLDAAKDIALKDANVKAADATFTKAKLDRDDGKDIYEIEFYTSDREYEYEIDAVSGKIIKNESERRKGSSAPANTGKDIGIEEAKLVALKHCGLSASDVVFTTAKKDRDDGVDCYELEFCTPEHEYEYEIHCTTGDILHNECHKHDRDDNDCGHHSNHH